MNVSKKKIKNHEVLKQQIEYDIICGKYRVNERLPTYKDMLQMYGYSTVTLNNALTELCEEQILRSDLIMLKDKKGVRHNGYILNDVRAKLKKKWFAVLKEHLDNFISTAKELNMNSEEVRFYFEECMKDYNDESGE